MTIYKSSCPKCGVITTTMHSNRQKVCYECLVKRKLEYVHKYRKGIIKPKKIQKRDVKQIQLVKPVKKVTKPKSKQRARQKNHYAFFYIDRNGKVALKEYTKGRAQDLYERMGLLYNKDHE